MYRVSETEFKPIGEWLVGRIINKGPESDYEKGIICGSKIEREILLLNSKDMRQFSVNLGPAVEVLWIESDTIFYKSADNLYKSRIFDNNVIDRIKLLNDPSIRYFIYGIIGKSIENK